MRKDRGITLIALVITIIILLILAGIMISLTIGENGILNYARESKIKTEEQMAREKLEMVLLDLQAKKYIDSTYNETDYINKKINDNGMIVSGDIVFVNGWKFQIDRSVPQIAVFLGKGEENDQIILDVSDPSYAVDYTKATIMIEITYNGELASIQINGENITIPEKTDEKYIIEKDILQNGTYTIFVKDINEGYKIDSKIVTNISEDMDIYTIDDLVAFRERVNRGATYEERTIRLMNSLDLKEICGQEKGSFEPIGNYGTDNTHIFKGTFQGNNHTIFNLYINTTNSYQGLFGYVQNGSISGVIIESIKNEYGTKTTSITGNAYVGGIVGCSNSATIQNCGNNANIKASVASGGIVGNCINSTIIGVYNKGDITSTGECSGGISGNTSDTTIRYSYNIGNITASYYIGGVIGGQMTNGMTISNCYNAGTITGTSKNPDGNSFIRRNSW